MHSWENVKVYFRLLFIKFLVNWFPRPKLCGNCAFLQNFHTSEITAFFAVYDCFLCFKVYGCTPSQKFQSYFLRMEISIRPDILFHLNQIYKIVLTQHH